MEKIQTTSLCKTCDTTWGEMAYQNLDSATFMGRFSIEAKRYCDSIDVTYFYNKSRTPKARILLSLNYNKNHTEALDTVLNSVAPKHFVVDKYEQPNRTADIFGLENGDVIVKELRIELMPHGNLQDLIVFIHGKPKSKTIANDEKDYLLHQLFGEELLLKKINNVDFKFTDTLNSNLLTLNEARIKLK
ncbi:MAG: hypothetical protein EOO46_17120 [Flavobacterium sp.]|nr:MAG: hypothetical protein EOO46_17120 [Flavobacterium sp.]